MRALVVGASGQVGAALGACLAARGHEWVGTYTGVALPGLLSLDLTDGRATERLVDELGPDAIFCAGALTHVDYCEEHPDEAFRLHRDAAATAARAAAKRGAAFVYYSTDYVFDGERGPYREDDAVRPLSVYGLSKLEGERVVLAECRRALVIRTTVVYGPEPQGKNTIYQLLRRGRAGERMRAPADQITSPTYNPDLAAASVELVERGHTGLLHVAGADLFDRWAFARLACQVFGLDESLLEPVTTASLAQRAARPLRGGLRIELARALLSTRLRGAEEGLRAMREAMEGAGGRR